MKQLLTAAQMKEADRWTSEEFGLDVLILMERAALSLAEAAMREHGGPGSVFVLAGMGNNGADGLAAARILSQRGCEVFVLAVGSEAKATKQWKYQCGLANRLGIDLRICADEAAVSEKTFKNADIYIDALFGIGLSRNLSGMYLKAVKLWNERALECRALRVAADICSGLDATTGEVLGDCTKADITVTFGYGKTGQYLYPAALYTGRLEIAEVGFAFDAKTEFLSDSLWILEQEDAKRMLPSRVPWGNKKTFGKVYVLAGSKGMAGAAYLSAMAAALTGAGLVYIITDEENRQILQTLIPQAVLRTYSDEQFAGDDSANEYIASLIKDADAIVAGPGLSTSQTQTRLLKAVLKLHGNVPLIIDADGLNILSENPGWSVGENTVLTPHPGELSRLLGKNTGELKKNMAACARELSGRYGAVTVCKDARTFIHTMSGTTFLNVTGNDGMAVGGSGDALTGIIAALAAQGLAADDAAVLGVWLHGSAGDEAAAKKNRYSMTAADILSGVSDVLKRLLQGGSNELL